MENPSLIISSRQNDTGLVSLFGIHKVLKNTGVISELPFRKF